MKLHEEFKEEVHHFPPNEYALHIKSPDCACAPFIHSEFGVRHWIHTMINEDFPLDNLNVS